MSGEEGEWHGAGERGGPDPQAVVHPARSNPQTLNSQPQALNPEPQPLTLMTIKTLNPRPRTPALNPRNPPKNMNFEPQPSSHNVKQILHPKPITLSPQASNAKSKPQASNANSKADPELEVIRATPPYHKQPDVNYIQVLEKVDSPCTVHAQRVPFKGNQLRAETG